LTRAYATPSERKSLAMAAVRTKRTAPELLVRQVLRSLWPKHLWLPCHERHGEAHSDSYGQMSWDKPAPTLTCKCHSLSNGRYGHPEQNRAISLREAATLQSFPEAYTFHSTSIAGLARQIGNAVPVTFATALGKQIVAALQP
jgi:DNA (cytosine-5)-methyltransferase 1